MPTSGILYPGVSYLIQRLLTDIYITQVAHCKRSMDSL
jgi:hypothetical protein